MADLKKITERVVDRLIFGRKYTCLWIMTRGMKEGKPCNKTFTAGRSISCAHTSPMRQSNSYTGHMSVPRFEDVLTREVIE